MHEPPSPGAAPGVPTHLPRIQVHMSTDFVLTKSHSPARVAEVCTAPWSGVASSIPWFHERGVPDATTRFLQPDQEPL